MFPIANWTVPTVTGTCPPPLTWFTLNTLPGTNRAVIFGGLVIDDTGAFYRTSDVYLIAYTKDLVVSYSMALGSLVVVCVIYLYLLTESYCNTESVYSDLLILLLSNTCIKQVCVYIL